MIQGTLPLAALIAVTTALAFLLDRKVPALGKVGASLLALILGALLSNLGVVPSKSPVYDSISGPVTNLAIAWLLLSVNLSDVKRAGPRMVGAFALAVAGTVVGAFVGALMLATSFGDQTWKLAGTLTGTYSGGSLNFVAVGNALHLPPALFAGGTAADALTTGIWMAITLVLPIWLVRFYPPVPDSAFERPPGGGSGGATVEEHHPFFAPASVSTLDLAVLMAAGLLLLGASKLVAGWVPQIPAVLWLTTFALLLGQTRPFHRPEGALQLGNLALHFFFVVIGIWSRVADIEAVGIAVFVYTCTVVGVQGLVVYGVGRLARLDVGSLSVASQAAVGGPSTALAVAVSREWPGLVLPGIIVGLLGYAVGNYLGIGVANLVHGFGIGL